MAYSPTTQPTVEHSVCIDAGITLVDSNLGAGVLWSPVGSIEYMLNHDIVTRQCNGSDPENVSVEDRVKSNCLLANLSKVDLMPPGRPNDALICYCACDWLSFMIRTMPPNALISLQHYQALGK